MQKIILGLLPLAVMAGLWVGGFGTAQTHPVPDALHEADMQYYLANQAFYAGDIDGALSRWQHIDAQAAADLCPGLTLEVDIRGQRLALCNPDALNWSEGMVEWRGETLAKLDQALAEGQLDVAKALGAQLTEVDPYSTENHALLAQAFERVGDVEQAEHHRQATARIDAGRVQAVEWVLGQKL